MRWTEPIIRETRVLLNQVGMSQGVLSQIVLSEVVLQSDGVELGGVKSVGDEFGGVGGSGSVELLGVGDSCCQVALKTK